MGYDQKYYRRHYDEYRSWEIAIARNLVERYKIFSIMDFGCGVGSFLEGALQRGITRMAGIEINYKHSKEFTPDSVKPFIHELDITQEIDLGSFDCAWTFEAAEHIQPIGTGQFVHNLVYAARRLIIMTAAPPGQAGTGHINLRPKQFWIEKICENGFAYREKEVEQVAESWAQWKNVPSYLIRNLMIFSRHEV